MQTAAVELVESSGQWALTRSALAQRVAAGRPAWSTSARSPNATPIATLQPSTPFELRTLRAIVPALDRLNPRTLASFTAAPGTFARVDEGSDGDPLAFHFQALLAGWSAGYPGQCRPANYGASEAEFTGSSNARTTAATSSFQRWHNALPGAAPLATTGAPDAPTYAALLRTAALLAAHAAVPRSPTAAGTVKTGLLGGISTGLGLAIAAAALGVIFRKEIGL